MSFLLFLIHLQKQAYQAFVDNSWYCKLNISRSSPSQYWSGIQFAEQHLKIVLSSLYTDYSKSVRIKICDTMSDADLCTYVPI